MSAVISRQAIVRTRPWRLHELVAGRPEAQATGAVAPAPEPLPAPVILPTIAELEALRAEGYEDGFVTGRAEAHKQVAGEVGALIQGIERITQQIRQVDLAYERFFVDVGLAIAQAIDVVPPAQLAKRVRQALATIARPDNLVLCMHPEDAACLREVAPDLLLQHGLEVTETEAISRGGFAIRSAFGEVDATLESSLQNLKKALQDAPV